MGRAGGQDERFLAVQGLFTEREEPYKTAWCVAVALFAHVDGEFEEMGRASGEDAVGVRHGSVCIVRKEVPLRRVHTYPLH